MKDFKVDIKTEIGDMKHAYGEMNKRLDQMMQTMAMLMNQNQSTTGGVE